MVDIPDLELEDLIEENTMSVIVRCLNPFVHKVGSLVKALPPPPPFGEWRIGFKEERWEMTWFSSVSTQRATSRMSYLRGPGLLMDGWCLWINGRQTLHRSS